MILLVALIASLVVALLQGGKLRHLASVPLRWGWVAFVAFSLQIAVIYFPLRRTEDFWGGHTLLLVVSYALLLLIVAVNRKIPGMLIIGIGLLLNLVVMLANGGFMPITWEALEHAGLDHLVLAREPGGRIMATKDVLLPREQTHLWFLSDVFVIGYPSPLRSVFSIGDVLLAVGAFCFFRRALRPPRAVSRAQPHGDPQRALDHE